MPSYNEKRRPIGKGGASELSRLTGTDETKNSKPADQAQASTHAAKARMLLKLSAIAADSIERAAIFAQAQVHVALSRGEAAHG